MAQKEGAKAGWDKLPDGGSRGERGEAYKKLGRKVLDIELAGVKQMLDRVDDEFVRACRYLRYEKLLGPIDKKRSGHVIVMGVGKSGHVGTKIAATLASTGTPAFFVHPAEAAHGDLGMLTEHDVVLALSNSGKTGEIVALLPGLKKLGIRIIAMTGNPDSPLAKAADVHLNVAVDKEACPLELAPTASTTAALAMGDALAVAVMQAEDFDEKDFGKSHPGGALGKRLLLNVAMLMHKDEAIPAVPSGAPLKDALLEMSKKGLGMTAIVDAGRKLLGIFTDGDLRRALDRDVNLKQTPIDTVMTRNPKVAREDMMATEALALMKEHKISALVVVDAQQRVTGALNMHDLLRAGLT
ncbi:MAG: KpsF/GutQ family sugar-phosphate isomerase [Gammaproteobacteria bacterium]